MGADVDFFLEQVAVVGAGGKMGRGISFLLAREMVRRMRRTEHRGRRYRLALIDARPEALPEVCSYIEAQIAREAKRDIGALRQLDQGAGGAAAEEQAARGVAADALSFIHATTDYREAQGARLVFEAVPEAERLKIETLRRLREACGDEAVFLSNTSSIPIQFLDGEAGVRGRIVGIHFYNPPAVQELAELVVARTTRPEVAELACELGARLGKTLVHARDVAGFIGNGHFMREVLHAAHEVERLRACVDEAEAIYAVNRVSQEGLVRPMGIFQLMDYVGIDIVSAILRVMSRHIRGETLHADLIDRMVSRQVLGGQRADGSQQAGFFQYDGRRPTAVYAPDRKAYMSIDDLGRVDEVLGPLGDLTWKALRDDPERAEKLREHFTRLGALDSLGARLTMASLRASRRIGEKLVAEGVAASPEDVNTVLERGFHHLYGPFNLVLAPWAQEPKETVA